MTQPQAPRRALAIQDRKMPDYAISAHWRDQNHQGTADIVRTLTGDDERSTAHLLGETEADPT